MNKSPLATTTIRVTVPRYWLGPMRAQSLRLPGCVRNRIGSEAHFARVMIYQGLRARVNLEAVREFEIKHLDMGIS
jgi:hypothetical protein